MRKEGENCEKTRRKHHYGSSECQRRKRADLHLLEFPLLFYVARPVFLDIVLVGTRGQDCPPSIAVVSAEGSVQNAPRQDRSSRARGLHPTLAPTNERTSRRDGVAGFPHRIFLNQIRRNRPTPRDPQQRNEGQLSSRPVACERTISRGKCVNPPSILVDHLVAAY